MSNDKYNRAIPELLEHTRDMTDWEREFMQSMATQYERSGSYSINQKACLDRLIKHYIDGVEPTREDRDKPKRYGNRIVTQKGRDGWHIYLDNVHVGVPVTFKEQVIIGTFLAESVEDIDRIAGRVKGTRPVGEPGPNANVEPPPPPENEGFAPRGKARF